MISFPDLPQEVPQDICVKIEECRKSLELTGSVQCPNRTPPTTTNSYAELKNKKEFVIIGTSLRLRRTGKWQMIVHN